MNIKETLNWCKEHGVSFKIIDVAGFKTVTARRANISATYEISESCDAIAVGEAVLNAIHAVKHGTEFNRQFGGFSPIGKEDRREKTRR